MNFLDWVKRVFVAIVFGLMFDVLAWVFFRMWNNFSVIVLGCIVGIVFYEFWIRR